MGAPLACPRCGVAAGPEDRFCTRCGFDLIGRPEAARTDTSGSQLEAPNDPADNPTWAALAHLSAFLLFTPVPLGNIVGPLAIWLLKRSNSRFIDQHGREALNFQISITLYFMALGTFVVISAILSILLIGLPFLFLGLFLMGVCALFWIVMVIVAAIRGGNGQEPGYRFAIRFLK
ncbi:MAG: DUF4870 domain-containing protein [Chloroflexi bacterium]|nr:DUF4870 domain-containing protein [Chloroflexota bacterium]